MINERMIELAGITPRKLDEAYFKPEIIKDKRLDKFRKKDPLIGKYLDSKNFKENMKYFDKLEDKYGEDWDAELHDVMSKIAADIPAPTPKYKKGEAVYIKSTNAIATILDIFPKHLEYRTDADGMRDEGELEPLNVKHFKIKGVNLSPSIAKKLPSKFKKIAAELGV